jgi:uncharacterized protein (DUF1778 family)
MSSKPKKQSAIGEPKPLSISAAPASEGWRNRIVAHGVVDAKELLANPKNYRLHPDNQKQALTAVLDQVGWVQSVLVNQRTGFVVDGHMRAAEAIARGQQVPVTYLDLSEDEENLVLASLDTISAAAVSDAEKFGELFQALTIDNQALDGLLSGYLDDANQTALKPAASGEGTHSAADRGLGKDREQTIKAVLYAAETAIFEGALKATGERNRGKALIKLCRFYLEQNPAEGQLNFSPEAKLATGDLAAR